MKSAPEVAPTPGRIVHFRDGDYSVVPAIVTRVGFQGSIDSDVSLALIREHGFEFVQDIEYDGDDDASIGTWQYPPRV